MLQDYSDIMGLFQLHLQTPPRAILRRLEQVRATGEIPDCGLEQPQEQSEEFREDWSMVGKVTVLLVCIFYSFILLKNVVLLNRVK